MIETGTDIENCGVPYVLVAEVQDDVAYTWLAAYKLRDVHLGRGTVAQINSRHMLCSVWDNGVFVVVSKSPKVVALSRQRGCYYIYAVA